MLPPHVSAEALTLVERRLGLRLPAERWSDLEVALSEVARPCPGRSSDGDWLAWLGALPDESVEWRQLAARLTISETYFFRDRAAFDALEGHVLPGLVAARRLEGNLRLRVWSSACATGEEAYSLAILLDRLIPDRSDWTLTVLATDLNPGSLARAAKGIYGEWSLREVPEGIREGYFHRLAKGAFEVKASVREMVTFAPLNLAGGTYPSAVTNTTAMDVVLCRNVLMYFADDVQREAVARLQRALVAGGWLLLAAAEASAELLRPMTPVNFPGAILYRNDRTPSPACWSPPPREPGWAGGVSPMVSVPASAVPSTAAPQRPFAAVNTDTRRSLLEQASELADRGHLEQATRLCDTALARDRLDPEAYLLRAAIAQEMADVKAALEALRCALYLQPRHPAAHVLLGALLLRAGGRVRGRRALETAIRLLDELPSDEVAAGSGGLTVGRLGEVARAYLAGA